jgi:hypothetical protein
LRDGGITPAGYHVSRLDQRRLVLLTDNIRAELDAFIADERGRPGDQVSDFRIGFRRKNEQSSVFFASLPLDLVIATPSPAVRLRRLNLP